ncbi:gliding motility lipoprotein GldH [Bacteroidales bacterium OttesenSCG-928-B11]|nr:gliding motility lipoprotein GldH [Bacteroidales bacterium OttesenSCG-928-E04]MDL2311916.1 gliding motility lipoprotein GldH [Bacteroidales bacterium OttesenSCG-928-B11]
MGKLVNNLLFLPALLLFSLLFTSCGGKVFYEKIEPIPDETWNIDSVLHFEFEVTDSMQFFNIYFDIRNSIEFETQNFYVFLTSQFPNGDISRDTLGFVLSNPYGEWKGRGSGRLKDNQFLYKAKVRFPICGIYKFSAVQGMRSDNVRGISEFGMSLFYFEKDNL